MKILYLFFNLGTTFLFKITSLRSLKLTISISIENDTERCPFLQHPTLSYTHLSSKLQKFRLILSGWQLSDNLSYSKCDTGLEQNAIKQDVSRQLEKPLINADRLHVETIEIHNRARSSRKNTTLLSKRTFREKWSVPTFKLVKKSLSSKLLFSMSETREKMHLYLDSTHTIRCELRVLKISVSNTSKLWHIHQ